MVGWLASLLAVLTSSLGRTAEVLFVFCLSWWSEFTESVMKNKNTNDTCILTTTMPDAARNVTYIQNDTFNESYYYTQAHWLMVYAGLGVAQGSYFSFKMCITC